MQIEIPELCLVALVGASGSGKTTFAQKHFKSTEVLSSDYFRGLVCDDENDQSATAAAFDSLFYIAEKRLDVSKLVVIDSTNVQKKAREQILQLAKSQDCFAVAIVFNFSEELCLTRNQTRTDRNFGDYVVRNQTRELKRSISRLQKEGFRRVFILNSPEEADAVEIIRAKLWSNKQEEHGPFDLIGDIHGCYDELCSLFTQLNYQVDQKNHMALPPPGRKAIFLGDLCDRGPQNVAVLRLVMQMVEAGHALCVPGNHEVKLLRQLRGANVQMAHGLEITVNQLAQESDAFRERVSCFIDGLISHYVLDNGKLVAAHGGIKEKYQGRSSGRVRSFCLYGDTTGETDEFGLPVRLPWADEYRGKALVVYGHTPSLQTQRVNNTICIDTGCVFGGKLTAYQYPEHQLVQVPALRQYAEPAKPLIPESDATRDMLNIQDVQGKRHIATSLYPRPITVREENAAAALEIMSRFAADPHWLIYLPPTMSPCETSSREEYLEHPKEAFAYYERRGIEKVVCEQKHMGSRAVIILCRSAEAAEKRFGVKDNSIGLIYTRTGRHFFENRTIEQTILSRLNRVLDSTGFWQDYATDWVCLDTELMPWSAKAQKLLQEQYAPVGRCGRDGLKSAVAALEKAAQLQLSSPEVDASVSGQSIDLAKILADYQEKAEALDSYTAAYRQYCWEVRDLEDYRIAPFHILATEGLVWSAQTHLQHMEVIAKYMTGKDPLFMATNHILVDLQDKAVVEAAVSWWLELTQGGGEGMVVKPLTFIATNEEEILQPAVKCRGREYLRIIYGPEYTKEAHMQRLKKRSLSKKRRLALAEFSLGMESLTRFVEKEPLYRVHECVFAVLAMESEPVDPRL